MSVGSEVFHSLSLSPVILIDSGWNSSSSMLTSLPYNKTKTLAADVRCASIPPRLGDDLEGGAPKAEITRASRFSKN